MAPPTKEEELSFEKIWKDAQKQFEDVTKKSLIKQNNPSLDTVLESLDSKFSDDGSKVNDKKAHLKEITGNVLSFIKLVGGLAAEGASLVFGPANMCFSAVQYLLDIPEVIDKFYEDIQTLFQDVSAFLMQFKIYAKIEEFVNVDFELKQSSHSIMIKFVEICALSIKILSARSWRKMGTVLKLVLLKNDQGVSEKLNEFQRLVNQNNSLSGAITLKHVLISGKEQSGNLNNIYEKLTTQAEQSGQKLKDSLSKIEVKVEDTNKDVKTLMAEAYDRSGTKVHISQMDRISGRLAILPNKAQEPLRVLEKIRSTSVKNTGAWLAEVPGYAKWIGLEGESEPLLILAGGGGSGKSNLLSAIAEQFKSNYQLNETGGKRFSVAYYAFIMEEAVRDSTSSEVARLTTAFKYMSIQLANHSVQYSKELSSYFEKKNASFMTGMGIKELASELFFPPTKKESKDAVYILLIDNIDTLSESAATQLLETLLQIRSPGLRIVVATTGWLLEVIPESLKQQISNVPVIHLEHYNKVDIKEYVETVIQQYKAFENKSETITRLKDLIREKLPEIEYTQGSFSEAKRIIEKIKNAAESNMKLEEVERLILEHQMYDNGVQEENMITRFNDTLNPDDIGIVNELLVWVLYGCERVTVPFMRQVLLLSDKHEPILGLDWIIKEKYTELFDIQKNGEILLGNVDQMYFQDSKRKTRVDTESSDDPMISLEIKIKNVKLSKVQRFFWDLNEKIVFDNVGRFNFDNALQEQSSKAQITANKTDGHFYLANRCFDLIFQDLNEKTSLLVPYAMQNVMGHLERLRIQLEENKEIMSQEEKRVIVQKLVGLLQSTGCVRRCLNSNWIWLKEWLDENTSLQAIWDWLNDPVAMATLGPKDQSWLRSVTSRKMVEPLLDITKMLAHEWAHTRRWTARGIIEWIDSFIQMHSHSEPLHTVEISGTDEKSSIDLPRDEEDPTSEAPELTELQRIQRTTEWIESNLELKKKDSLWFERLGDTYLETEEIEDNKFSIEAFLNAKQLPQCSWTVSKGLAEAYDRNGDTAKGIKELKVVLEHLLKLQDRAADDNALLATTYEKSGYWKAKINLTEDAIVDLKEAIRHGPQLCDPYIRLIEMFLDNGREQEALEVLQKLNEGSETNHKLENRLQGLFIDLATRPDPVTEYNILFQAAKASPIIEMMLDQMGRAAKHISENFSNLESLGRMLLCQGVGHARYSSDPSGLKTAQACWSQSWRILFQEHGSEHWEYVLQLLANYHYSEAKMARKDSEDFKIHFDKLNELIYLASKTHFNSYIQIPTRPLARLYLLSDKSETARELLMGDMQTAFDMLSDEDPDNDHCGYHMMALVLMHIGDDLNALTAFSLLGPKETPGTSSDDRIIHLIDESKTNIPTQTSDALRDTIQKAVIITTETQTPHSKEDSESSEQNNFLANSGVQDMGQSNEVESRNGGTTPRYSNAEKFSSTTREGDLWEECSCACGNLWTYVADFCLSKVCYNMVFGTDCLGKLKSGTLRRYICDKDHPRLHIPPWSDDDYQEVISKGKVWVGGKLIDGTSKREGGEVVTVDEWLRSLKEEWKIEIAGS